jgi:hypothetical protein
VPQHNIGRMNERVVELYRILKTPGSLYLHCDPHASRFLKVMLDDIFGAPHPRWNQHRLNPGPASFSKRMLGRNVYRLIMGLTRKQSRGFGR